MTPKSVSIAVISVVLLIIVLKMASTEESTNVTGDTAIAGAPSIALSCDSPAVKTSASSKLAKWLDENVGKDNAYHVHGAFVAEISTSVVMGTIQGIHQCLAIASVAIRQPSGALLISKEMLNLHFLLASDQITLDEGDLLSNATVTADTLLVREAMQPSAAPISEAQRARFNDSMDASR